MTDFSPINPPKPSENSDFGVPDLPTNLLRTYARVWQLETWLRKMVYVEFRALKGDDWASLVPKVEKSQQPKEADKRLTHMPTREENPLSYVQFRQLCNGISEQWRLFEPFLPPQKIWDAKIEEVTQIRHRVAHFRVGHDDDLARVHQLLRDIDKGFWHFCTSYNDPTPVLPQSDDSVTSHFLHLDQFPWSQVEDRKWARIGIADPAARLGMTIEIIRRPWATWSVPIEGREGFLFDVQIHARRSRELNYRRILQSTSRLHKHVVHIALDNLAHSFRVTIPAILGADCVKTVIEGFFEEAESAVGSYGGGTAKEIASDWPEYVLGPDNPLTFLEPDMPCSFFGA